MDSKYVWGYRGNMVYRNYEDENNYRQRANYSVWLRNLLKNKTDYLFIYSELHTAKPFPIEDEWASTHPEKFNLVFKNNDTHIYKLIK